MCTPQTITQETPCNNTMEWMIIMEIGEYSLWYKSYKMKLNEECLLVDLNHINELWDKAQIQKEANKQWAMRRYNAKIKPIIFHKKRSRMVDDKKE